MTTLAELEDIQNDLQVKDSDFNIYDRGEMYLRLYSLTDSPATALEGNIATFSGIVGGAAFLANYVLADNSQNGKAAAGYSYSMTNAAEQPNDVYGLSHAVATDHMIAVVADFNLLNGNNGNLSVSDGNTAAAKTWLDRSLPDQFPGEIFGIYNGTTVTDFPIPVGLWLPGGDDGKLAAISGLAGSILFGKSVDDFAGREGYAILNGPDVGNSDPYSIQRYVLNYNLANGGGALPNGDRNGDGIINYEDGTVVMLDSAAVRVDNTASYTAVNTMLEAFALLNGVVTSTFFAWDDYREWDLLQDFRVQQVEGGEYDFEKYAAQHGIGAEKDFWAYTEQLLGDSEGVVRNLVYTYSREEVGTSSTDYLYGGVGNDILAGGGGTDFIRSGWGSDVLYGGAGRDWLYGERGVDILNGGDGDDILFGGFGNDLLNGESGRDIASYLDIAGATISVTMNGTNGTVDIDYTSLGITYSVEQDALISIEIIEGTAGDDYFAGGDAKVLFIGGAGSDRYFLSESSPIYLLEKLGDTGTDVLLVNGATPDVSYGTTSSRGTWVEGENGAPSFFIPKAIEAVNAGNGDIAASAYTDTHGPTNISATVDGGYKLFVNSEKDNVWNTSPLVLDLDNNGITLAPLYGEGSVYFDIDNDGMAEAVGWVSGNDGLLVIDKDGNGTIDDRSELFGNKHNYDYLSQSQTWNYDNGFETLKDYDSNNDARITAADDSFSDLLVWIDVNSDGVSQAGELHTLSSLSITEISTNYEIINEENQGNYIYQEGSFYINGNRQNISDVWFSYDNLNSQYTGEISIGADIVYLPDLRGYGQLSDLQIAMSDNTDLAALMSDYIAQDYAPEDIGSRAQILELKDVLYEWAGVRGLDLSNRLSSIELVTTGNDVAFLEAYFDRAYDNGGLVYNVGVITIFRALNNIMDDMSAQIFFQSAASDYLFVQKPFYNSVTHDFSNNFVFDIAAFEAKILMFAEDDISRLKFVANTLTMFKSALGFDNLSAADITELESLVSDTLSYWGVTLPQASNISIVASVHSVTENGTELNDLLVGRDGFVDSLYGGDGDDVLVGLAGGNTLDGGEGNDSLYGGDGDDNLNGGNGDDVYFFSKGSDTARDTSGFDTLLFGEGISLGDLTIEKRDDGSYFGTTNNLIISDGAGNSILFNQQFYGTSSQLDILQFANGTTVQLSSIEIDSHGTEGNDFISGIETGDLSTDDIMFGHGGNDTISGNSGADILYGGSGDDYLSGGLGFDIAYGGIGNDYIRGGDGLDTLHGNEGDDRLYGQEGDDTLFGGDGNDTLYGDDTFSSYAGNDTYYAGSGNDIINDRYGDDTYYYTAGFDTINDSDGTDVIILTEGVISGDIQVFNAGASDLLITINSIMSQGQIYIYGQRLSGPLCQGSCHLN